MSFRITDKENREHASTINVGINQAKGNYFKVIDADDWLITENLDNLIEFLECTNDDLVLNPYVKFYENTRQEEVVNYSYQNIIHKGEECFLNYTRKLPKMHSMTIKTSILFLKNIRIDGHMFYVDLEYVNNVSLITDFKIILQGVKTVLFGNNL